MKELGAKLFELLIKKDWTITCLSIILGILSISFWFPDFEDRLPFGDTWNPFIGAIIFTLAFHLALRFLKVFFKKCFAFVVMLMQPPTLSEEEMYKSEDALERTKCKIDSFSDLEYSVIIYLLDNKNTIPYKERTPASYNSILHNTEWFTASPYDEVHALSATPYLYQYLLTQKTYDKLIYIRNTTGKLSHFDRQSVKID